MLVTIKDVLSADAVRTCREALAEADWIDGRATAGAQSGAAKHNLQVAEGSPCARRLGERVLDALSRSPTFLAAAMPLRIFPPLFNCYREGQRFDAHVDNAVRRVPGRGAYTHGPVLHPVPVRPRQLRRRRTADRRRIGRTTVQVAGG